MPSDPRRWSQEDLDRHLARLKPKPTRDDALFGVKEALAAAPFKTAGMRPRKFRNVPVLVTFAALELVNGHQRLCHTFDSGKEAEYYGTLALRRQAGELEDLRLQEPFALMAHRQDGKPEIIGEWFADFVFHDLTLGRRIYCDVKSDATRTAVYKIKKKIIEACHGFLITEV